MSYGAGGAALSAARSVKRGRVYAYQRRVELDVDARTGEVGKVVDHTFRAGEGRQLIRRVADELGWKEGMNAEQKGGLIVGIAAIVLTVGVFAAIGINALLG